MSNRQIWTQYDIKQKRKTIKPDTHKYYNSDEFINIINPTMPL